MAPSNPPAGDSNQDPLQLTGNQRRQLRGLAHHLKPTVMVGQHGATEALAASVDQALFDHELIKVKILENSPNEPATIGASLVEMTGALLVQRIGRTVILYRRHPEDPRIHLHVAPRGRS